MGGIFPTVETVGYSRASLRDEIEARNGLRFFHPFRAMCCLIFHRRAVGAHWSLVRGRPRWSSVAETRFAFLSYAGRRRWQCLLMLSADMTKIVLDLPAEDRLELARRLVESVVWPASLNEAVAEGIRRIEDVAAGRATGLTEEQFRSALQ